MSLQQIALLLLALAALSVLWWMRRRAALKRREGIGADPDRIDTLVGWPPQATRVLSTVERQVLSTLVRALPEYTILAQVPLSRFLRVPKRHSYADWLRRLGYQCADFIVCDLDSQVLAVVEIQGPTGQANDRTRRRLERMARSLKAAKVPLHIWTEGRLPSADAARDAIAPRRPAAPVSAPPAALPSVPTTPPLLQPAGNPFENSDRDSGHDERIEPLEPPPSTWFDDLDSAPAPLRKP
jgi:hypothetical protein